MTPDELLAHCLAKPGAWQDEPWEGDVVAKVGDKIFAFLGRAIGGRQVRQRRDEADEWLLRYPDDASVMAYIGRSGWNTLSRRRDPRRRDPRGGRRLLRTTWWQSFPKRLRPRWQARVAVLGQPTWPVAPRPRRERIVDAWRGVFPSRRCRHHGSVPARPGHPAPPARQPGGRDLRPVVAPAAYRNRPERGTRPWWTLPTWFGSAPSSCWSRSCWPTSSSSPARAARALHPGGRPCGSRSTWSSRCSSASASGRSPARQYVGRVLRRVAHRVQPLGRQPVRLRDHHGAVRGAAAVPAEGAADRHRAWRSSCAASSSPLGAAAINAVRLGLLHLRAVPDLHRGQAGHQQAHQGDERRLRGERAHPVGSARAAADTKEYDGAKLRHQRRRQEGLHPDVHRDHRDRHHRPALRARLDPGDLRPHQGAVHRLHRERLRADGPAPAVLPDRRPAATGWSTCQLGLAVMLGFIGVKLVLHALHENELPFINGGEPIDGVPEVPIWLSLTVIVATLLVTTVASLLQTRRVRRRDRTVDHSAGTLIDPPGHQPRARHSARCGRSAPSVVSLPCPGYTQVSSGSRSNSLAVTSPRRRSKASAEP